MTVVFVLSSVALELIIVELPVSMSLLVTTTPLPPEEVRLTPVELVLKVVFVMGDVAGAGVFVGLIVGVCEGETEGVGL